MQRRILATLAGLAVWCGAGLNQASAQFGNLGQPPPRQRPTVSPYINLGAGGNAFNYYGLVKPQTEAMRSIQQLQQGMGMLNADGSPKGPLGQQTPGGLAPTGLQTGHMATFFNYSHYYPPNPYMGTMYGNTFPMGGLGGYGMGMGGMGGVGGNGMGNTFGNAFGATGTPVFFGQTFNTGAGGFRR